MSDGAVSEVDTDSIAQAFLSDLMGAGDAVDSVAHPRAG